MLRSQSLKSPITWTGPFILAGKECNVTCPPWSTAPGNGKSHPGQSENPGARRPSFAGATIGLRHPRRVVPAGSKRDPIRRIGLASLRGKGITKRPAAPRGPQHTERFYTSCSRTEEGDVAMCRGSRGPNTRAVGKAVAATTQTSAPGQTVAPQPRAKGRRSRSVGEPEFRCICCTRIGYLGYGKGRA